MKEDEAIIGGRGELKKLGYRDGSSDLKMKPMFSVCMVEFLIC